MKSVLLLVLMATLDCGTASEPPATPPAESTSPAQPLVDAQPDCDDSSFSPVLAAYDEIVADHRFSLVLDRDARGVWSPSGRLDMPLHHASTIEWDNQPVLDGHSESRVRVEAVGIGRKSLDHRPDVNTWFATYAAHIVRSCPAEQ